MHFISTFIFHQRAVSLCVYLYSKYTHTWLSISVCPSNQQMLQWSHNSEAVSDKTVVQTLGHNLLTETVFTLLLSCHAHLDLIMLHYMQLYLIIPTWMKECLGQINMTRHGILNRYRGHDLRIHSLRIINLCLWFIHLFLNLSKIMATLYLLIYLF